jgi:hypothetical protein
MSIVFLGERLNSAPPTAPLPSAVMKAFPESTTATVFPQADPDLGIRKLRNPGKGWTPDATLPEPDVQSTGAVPALAPNPGRREPPLGLTSPKIAGMEKWQGVITEVGEDEFTAELVPIDHDGPTVVAEFDLAAVTPSEVDDFVVGASFYLAVRTVDNPGRGRSLTSVLRLRRLGVWTVKELDEVRWNATHAAARAAKYIA